METAITIVWSAFVVYLVFGEVVEGLILRSGK
jgi:hypothetical protein